MGIKKPDINNLLGYLREQHALLILDNCEHVLETVRVLVNHLLEKCNQLKLLATSREGFYANNDNEYPVLPLSYPGMPNNNLAVTGRCRIKYTHVQLSLEQLQTFTAVSLFVTRAKEADKKFTLDEQNAQDVVKICAALNGNPLAISIVASYVEELEPTGVKAEIESKDYLTLYYFFINTKRHRTLNEVYDWSYKLLNTEEQTLFRCLAVFAGGCSTEAAEKVCSLHNLPSDRNNIVSNAKKLKLHNLIRYQNNRLEITHKTIDDYALSKLQENKKEERAIRRRHRDFFLDLAKSFFPRFLHYYQEVYPDFLLDHPKFSSKPKVHEENRLPGRTDSEWTKGVFLEYKQRAFYLADPLLRLISSTAMEGALLEHQNFYEAMKWTFKQKEAGKCMVVPKVKTVFGRK